MKKDLQFRWLFIVLLCGLLFTSAGISLSQEKESAKTTPAEAAKQIDVPGITWTHDLDKALDESARTGRPVITYFTYDT